MTRVGFSRAHPEAVERLRAWMHELTKRRERSLRRSAPKPPSGSVPTYSKARVARSSSMPGKSHGSERARLAAGSGLPIDLEHKQVMARVREGPTEVEPLFDIERRG